MSDLSNAVGVSGFDALAELQNGFDGVLREFRIDLKHPQGFSAVVELEVLSAQAGWSRLAVNFAEVDFARLGEWVGKASGGNVLYEGARLIVDGDRLTLDLSPGPAWNLTGDASIQSNFMLIGRGTWSILAVERA